MNQDILNVAFEESIDSEAIDQLKQSLEHLGQDVAFHETPEKGPQASILLLGISSVAILFGGAFVKKLGDKAAEDAYPHIKNALSKLYTKYFGEDPKYKVRILTTSENKAPDTKYSLILALYCVGKDNQRAKFLYETTWSKEQFEMATDVYIQAMTEFVSNDQSEVSELIIASESRMEPHLIAWDPSVDALVRINALPSHVRI
ncbi:hypothetical protein ACQKE9_13385 [Shewanella vesiculosa]|uniref:hypothetical protein n=1 Tax=Shewanella vesiculosa TaxID=518738 RepID=UPI003CFD6701